MIAVSSTEPLPWRDLREELVRFVGARAPACEVDDIVQDALAKIHVGIASVRDHERLGPWLYRVTRNAIVDHHRRARPVEELAAETAALDVDAEDLTAQVLARCMTGFVALLPPVYRQAITLVELEGRSQIDAAAQLGIPLSTMKSRVQRGRAQLRTLVEECCAISLDARGHVIEVTPRGKTCSAC